MTFITHAAFGALTASAAGQGWNHILAAALGSFLPDIDSHRSLIGRVFFFISIPLYRKFGHREEVHSVFVWLILVLIGFFLKSQFLQWMGIGALSHAFIDCFNTKGAAILKPLTERIAVIFKNPNWRIRSGQREEIIFGALLITLLIGTQHIQAIGGYRSFFGSLLKSPQITVEHYIESGNIRSHVDGRFRWNDGRIQEVQWLIVGTEGDKLVCWDGQRLIRPKHGEFLRAALMKSQKEWGAARVQGIVTVLQDSFYFAGGKWYFARKGQKAFGSIKSVSGEIPQIKVGTK